MSTTNESEAKRRIDEHFEQLEIPDAAIERVETLYRRIGDGEPAADVLDVPGWLCPLAEMYARRMFDQGKFEEAMRLVDGVLALDDSRYYPYLLTGLYLLEEEQTYGRAADFLAQARERGPEDDPSITYHLAEAFVLDGEVELGLSQLQATLERTQDEPEHPYRERALVLLERLHRMGSDEGDPARDAERAAAPA